MGLFSVWFLLAAFGILAVLRRVIYVTNTLRRVRGIPVYFCIAEPISLFSMPFPQSSWTPNIYHAWSHKDRYARCHAQAILFLPLLFGKATIHCASSDAIKQILLDISTFVKPEVATALDLMGPNLVTLNSDDWRRHRKVTSPAFDGQIYRDVWRVTTDLYNQMMRSDAWKSGDNLYFRNFNVFTTRLALLVIAACGFNMDIEWDGELRRNDLKHSVDSTIVTVSKSLFARIWIPHWVYYIPSEWLRKIDVAYNELDVFLQSSVASKKQDLDRQPIQQITAANRNLFSRIVMASMDERGFTDREIIGNLFIYLFAGHETTAHALVSTLALLAINPGEQERVHDHIVSVVGDRKIEYDDYANLTPVLHCFYETLRLYPAATNMMRVAKKDSVLNPARLTPQNDPVYLPKDLMIILDIIGACRDPNDYIDPDAFQPQRWESSGDAAVENFLVFSTGPRQCLGKKFSTTEAVCFLSHILRDWKFDLKLRDGQTPKQWQEEFMQPSISVTLKIENIPLLASRRI